LTGAGLTSVGLTSVGLNGAGLDSAGFNVVSLAALAPLLALLGAIINGLFGRRLAEPLPGVIGSAAVGGAFLLSLLAFVGLLGRGGEGVAVPLWTYLSAGTFRLELGFIIDNLSVVMMLIITGVGLLIHLYSVGYMHGDEGFSRYFAGLNLFVAAMLILVMADNYLLMFVGWEGVGVCSFLLIGFWYGVKPNADAARKAFIVNRIGDVGFLLAMFLIFRLFGTLNIAEVNSAVSSAMFFGAGAVTLIGLFFLVAAAGKSAQFPLQVWLPDAMAGPTPVSALIHAATMVTAGVYLVARTAPLFAQTPAASAAVAWVGAITALIAAFAALSQTDIKKILAYSTISQLGFMFVAVGVGAYWVGIFHVFTHAFFKALLFLCAGSVIHALGGEQDIRRMGGLGKHMKVTGGAALVGVLAISGVPLFSGFFSKDAILAHTFNATLIAGYGNTLIFALLLVSTALTAFYMFRWYYLTFAGPERLTREAKAQLHESPRIMTVPLVVLAVLSVVAGSIGLPADLGLPNLIGPWLTAATAHVGFAHPALWLELALIGVSVLAAAVGLGLGYYVYHLHEGRPVARSSEGGLARLGRLSREGGGFDLLYRRAVVSPAESAASSLAILDRELLDHGVIAAAESVGLLATVLARFQSGFVRAYALVMFIGAAFLVLVAVMTTVLP
jgi:NADH-quinone oxidoreductase subunit L